jgi:CheY-like chemotaxis protein/Flp pilus assembly protein TadD
MPLADRSMNILIVDDKRNMRRTIKNILRKIGYERFEEADDGDTALVKLTSNEFDLVLCDWNMPRMNGSEVLKAVREKEDLKDIPFLMITAEMNEETVAQVIETEVDDYLLKPFTPSLLQEKIDKILQAKSAPSPIETHLNLGQVHLKSRQYKEALAEFKKAIGINPQSPRAWLAVGQVSETLGELDKAEEVYRKAVDLSPQFIKAHEALAGIYQARGDAEKAAESLQAAVMISPKNPDRQMNLGKALIKTGKTEEAKKAFGTVMDLAKANQSEMARQIGEVYLEAGLEAEAQDIFLEGLAASPNDLHLFNRLGIAYRKQKKFKEAVANYEKALKIDPHNENLFYNLGRAHYEDGNKEKSALAMRAALKLYPQFEEAEAFLARVLKVEAR